MTVCVACLADHGANLILASDREISGLTKYPTTDPKIVGLTTSIVVMWSGDDVTFQALIHAALKRDVDARVLAAPTSWLRVEDVAFLYQQHYNAAWQHRLEQRVLMPFKHTLESFNDALPDLPESFVQERTQEIRAFKVAAISALVVGMDMTGASDATGTPAPMAHIYKFEAWGREGTVSCEDGLGYAAIGSGEPHAISALTSVKHGPSTPMANALWNVYVAKKRGQAAPGVGDDTDIFFFQWRTPNPGACVPLDSSVAAFMDKSFGRLRSSEDRAMKKAQDALTEMLKKGPPPPPTGQAPKPPPAPPSPSPAPGSPPPPETKVDGPPSNA